VAGKARHPGRSTFYTVLPVGGVKGQLPGLTAPPSSFQPPSLLPSFLPSFLFRPVMTQLPPRCAVTGLQRLLLAASPVDTVVMSLPPGSTIGHPHPPQWAASLVYNVGEWGGWATAGRWDGIKPSLPVCPSPRPSRGHWLKDYLEKTAQKSPTLLTCQTPSPSLCVTLHRRTNYQTNTITRCVQLPRMHVSIWRV